MHLGNALSALLSWLSARSQGGQWLLRIEDLDTGRSRPEFIAAMEDDLRWLGLEWDEGGSSDPFYCQSKRSEIYNEAIDRLINKGLVYPCWCSRADLMAANAPHQSDGRVVYAGTCRPSEPYLLHSAEARGGRMPAWRVMVPDAVVSVNDLHYGNVSVNLAGECGDFIVRRSDGVAAYQLAVVVDDALMGVTEVVRGSDLLLSSPQQAWLHGQLGFTPPVFAHLPLLCASDGRRLCKRDKDMDLGALRAKYSPEQVIGRLALLSGLRPSDEPVRASELIADFDWSKIPTRDILLNHFWGCYESPIHTSYTARDDT